MKRDYKFRQITVDDYPHLIKWWKKYEKFGILVPKATLLPNKGLGGFVVEKNGVAIASCFLYFTNSAFGYVDYLIADPDYREEDRDKIMLEFGVYVTQMAAAAGCELVKAITSNKNLVKLLSVSAKNGHAEQLEDGSYIANGVKLDIKPEPYYMVYTHGIATETKIHDK